MNKYEIKGKKGFIGCCSRKLHAICICKENSIIKKYEDWDINIPNDLYEINKYFNNDDSILEYYGKNEYDYKIVIELEINDLIKFLDEFLIYNKKIQNIKEKYFLSDEFFRIKDKISELNNYIDNINEINSDNENSDNENSNSNSDMSKEYEHSEDNPVETLEKKIKNSNIRLKKYIKKLDTKKKELKSIKSSFNVIINNIKYEEDNILEERRLYIRNFNNI